MAHDLDRVLVDVAQQPGGEDVVGIAVGPGASVGQDDDAVGMSGGDPQVVQHDDGGCTLSGPGANELEHLLLVADVERSGRLVEQEEPGVLRDDPSQAGPGAFAP